MCFTIWVLWVWLAKGLQRVCMDGVEKSSGWVWTQQRHGNHGSRDGTWVVYIPKGTLSIGRRDETAGAPD